MKAIYEKEVQGFFCTMFGYVYIAFTLLITGILFTAFNLQGGRADFGYTLQSTVMVLLIIIPIITMRTLGDERRMKTDQLLMTAPVSALDIVAGKFLAVFTTFAIPVAVCALCPLILGIYGKVPLIKSYACFPPFLLMGGACIAIGIFISSLTENPILCAVETFCALLICYLMPSLRKLLDNSAAYSLGGFAISALLFSAAVAAVLRSRRAGITIFGLSAGTLGVLYLVKPAMFQGALSKFLSWFSLFSRFDDFVNGIFSVPHIVYYCSVILLFIYLAVQSLEFRRCG